MNEQQQQQQQQQPPGNQPRICRVCLSIVDVCMEINTVEHLTGFMPYRDKLALVVPEMMLDMIQDPAICIECSNELQQAYKFKQKCMQTEEKIRRLVQSYGGVIYSLDLSNIADRSKLKVKTEQPPPVPITPPPLVPRPSGTTASSSQQEKTVKFPPAIILKVTPQKQRVPGREVNNHGVISLKKIENVVPMKEKTAEQMVVASVSGERNVATAAAAAAAKGEIEFHAVNELEEKQTIHDNEMEEVEEEEEGSLLVPKSEEAVHDPLCDYGMAYVEDKRSKLFRVVCNFCGKAFMGMFCLRKHQRVCKGVSSEIKPEVEIKPIKQQQQTPVTVAGTRRRRKPKAFQYNEELTKEKGKRVTLPSTAKNLLQIWLYNHRDNPYPTDVDKLELVRETNLSLIQVENWFINARRRILQKMLAKGSKYEAELLKHECSDEEWS